MEAGRTAPAGRLVGSHTDLIMVAQVFDSRAARLVIQACTRPAVAPGRESCHRIGWQPVPDGVTVPDPGCGQAVTNASLGW